MRFCNFTFVNQEFLVAGIASELASFKLTKVPNSSVVEKSRFKVWASLIAVLLIENFTKLKLFFLRELSSARGSVSLARLNSKLASILSSGLIGFTGSGSTGDAGSGSAGGVGLGFEGGVGVGSVGGIGVGSVGGTGSGSAGGVGSGSGNSGGLAMLAKSQA